MSCNCKVCTDHRKWLTAINPQTEESRAALDEILSRLAMAETDAAVWQAKYEGHWETPNNQRPILGTRYCNRCNKPVHIYDAAGLAATVVYCSIECAD